MKPALKRGQTLSLERIVSQEDTAARYGSGDLDVLATPALVAFMENTALSLVAPHLPESESTVGIAITLDHVRATAVGRNVKCTAVLEKIEGNRLLFDVTAWDGSNRIGYGKHTRYIIDIDRFMSKLDT